MTKEGTVLDGKYEILAEVGRGGMSIVYLARDKRLNKQWAVKEIKNDGKKSAKTLLKGLEREANILKNVDHPVLPRIVDIINQDGTIYVVMDYIEGDTIQDRLKKEGAQPQELVVEWGLQLASALNYLHNMNPPVIYRDMKPSNVMIKPEGGVKLIDFGTAKEYEIENNADTTALGTRGYAAPEQFGDSKGRGIYNTDARTDIYNLGATLYHIVTGKNPCEPPYEIKPIREWNPMLSSGLEKIILKCTQADPNDRYQNCTELMYALEHYDELDDSYRKKNKKKLGLFAATVALAVVSGITAGIGYSGMQRIKLNNYNQYIENGMNYCREENYEAGTAEFKKAIELDGSEEKAYEQYIQAYIDATKAYFCGDIGCYTLGNAMPLDMVDTCLCMGAGITMAQGFHWIDGEGTCFGFVGDSTFFASGMTGVVNAVYNNADMILCVLDNSTTAMTGHQPHPGIGRNMMGQFVDKVDIAKVLEGIGVHMIVTVNPLDLDASVAAVQECAKLPGVKAIIFKSPCIAISKPDGKCRISEQCINCKKCIREIGCPALITVDGNVTIDENLCTGCGLCSQICPVHAIGGDTQKGGATS